MAKRMGSMAAVMVVLMGALLPLGWPTASAQAWPSVQLVEIENGLSSPLHLTHAGDGSGRLFVAEQAGRIIILKDGQTSLFLDITGRVRSPANGGGSEEGLLSLAFPPGYGTVVSHFYVFYTNKNSDNQVSRLHLGASPDQADPGSEETILVVPHPTYSNHNGGQIAFGPDGYLYIGLGDGGGSGDPDGNAQNPASLMGKLLRISVENPPVPALNQALYLPLVRRGPGGGLAYQIPPDNPFANNPAFRPEIWAWGLRNPWRFSFDRQTGDLWIGDVGQNAWEEIDHQPASSPGGENYGWDVWEGNTCYSDPGCSPAGFTPPVWVYAHASANCSVTGGHVYRGSESPGLQGIYFFADYCSGRLWGLRYENNAWVDHLFLDTPLNIASFGESQTGELFLVDIGAGTIWQIIASP